MASSISVISMLGLERVRRASAPRRRGHVVDRSAASCSSQSTSRPACTKTGASSQPPLDAVVLQPVAQLVLAVGGLQRRSASAPWRPARRRPPAARRASPAASASMLAVGEQRELVPHPGDPVAQRDGGPDGRRGRVVELVGQPGGERAERDAAAPAGRRRPASVRMPQEQALEQVHRHREPVAQHAGANSSAGSAKKRDVGQRPQRGRVAVLRPAVGSDVRLRWRPRTTPALRRCGRSRRRRPPTRRVIAIVPASST